LEARPAHHRLGAPQLRNTLNSDGMGADTTTEERVVLVNEHDQPIGTMGKLRAHQVGALHRAFSVFLFDRHGRLLLQKRAPEKYHSAGLWTNTCCGHPRANETLDGGARRRLMEEMGVDARLERRFSFRYKARLPNGLYEHEVDHVFFGHYDGDARPDASEVADTRHMTPAELDAELRAEPGRFTVWLRECWDRV